MKESNPIFVPKKESVVSSGPFTDEKPLRESVGAIKQPSRGPSEQNRSLLKEALLKATMQHVQSAAETKKPDELQVAKPLETEDHPDKTEIPENPDPAQQQEIAYAALRKVLE